MWVVGADGANLATERVAAGRRRGDRPPQRRRWVDLDNDRLRLRADWRACKRWLAEVGVTGSTELDRCCWEMAAAIAVRLLPSRRAKGARAGGRRERTHACAVKYEVVLSQAGCGGDWRA